MQTLFHDYVDEHDAALGSVPEKQNDKLLGVRVVLLIATALSLFMPWPFTFALAVAFFIALVWPKS
jgi:hypothetical protein